MRRGLSTIAGGYNSPDSLSNHTLGSDHMHTTCIRRCYTVDSKNRRDYANSSCIIADLSNRLPQIYHSTTTDVNSALHPSEVAKSSTSFAEVKGGNVTPAGW